MNNQKLNSKLIRRLNEYLKVSGLGECIKNCWSKEDAELIMGYLEDVFLNAIAEME